MAFSWWDPNIWKIKSRDFRGETQKDELEDFKILTKNFFFKILKFFVVGPILWEIEFSNSRGGTRIMKIWILKNTAKTWKNFLNFKIFVVGPKFLESWSFELSWWDPQFPKIIFFSKTRKISILRNSSTNFKKKIFSKIFEFFIFVAGLKNFKLVKIPDFWQ